FVDAGKLSHCSTSASGRDLFLDRLDHGYEIVSTLRRPLQPLRRNLSGAGVDHHFAHLDVFHLFVSALRRKVECDSSPRTRRENKSRSGTAGGGSGLNSFLLAG